MRFFAPKKPTLSGVNEVDRARIEDLQSLVDDKPGDLRARRQLGDAFRAVGKISEAVEQYQALVGAYAAQGLLFKAIAACKLILELRPDDDETSQTLGQLYARRTAGKESAELSGPMSAALHVVDDGDVIESSGGHGGPPNSMEGGPVSLDDGDVVSLPPPIPEDDEEIVDVSALAAALTPLAEGAMRLERPPSVPLFSGLSQASFASLVKKLSAWEADAGAVVVGEGEESDSVFVVVRGRVRVERSNIVLATLGADSFFGEMALLSKKPRAATVIAEVKTELLELPRSVLEEIVADDPAVAQALDHFSRTRLLANLARTSPLLKDLPVDVVAGAVAAFGKKSAVAGDVLVEEGKAGPGLFVVLTGELDVSAIGELGPVRIKRLDAGDVFGEMSLVVSREKGGGDATATVTAASECALLFLEREAFGAFAKAHPTLVERLAHLAQAREAFNARFLVPDETSSAVLV